MSQLLKRTKKSCLKLLRKLSTKQIFVKRLEEDDTTPDNDCTMVVEHVKKSPICTTTTTTTTNHKQNQKETIEEEEQQQQLSNININTAAKHNVDENCNQTVLQTLTTKFFHNSDNFEFKRLPSNHNDAVSEIIPYEVDLIGKKHHHQNDDDNDGDDDDDDNVSTKDSSALTLKSIVFAKMNYKQNVRYLRHTPSSTSLENSTYPVNCSDDDNDADDAVEDSKGHLGCNGSTITNQTTVSNAYTTVTTTTTTSIITTTTIPITTTTTHSSYSTNGGLLHLSHNNLTKLHKTYQSTQHLPVNVSLGSKSNGNYQQLIISEEPDYFFKMTPVVKWDINGNSLEDESSLWLNFENLSQNRQRRHLNGEQQQQQQQQQYHHQGIGDNESCKSSYRSSSSTLYTWLEEDDSLDSVNSHLLNDTNLSYPKRCLI